MKIPGSGHSFLRTNHDNIHTNEDELWTDVIAIEPDTRNWTHKTQDGSRKVTIKRRQFPLLLHKTSTLQGIQGKIAEPGMCAHWSFPTHLSAEALWLAHYVILSRQRSLKDLVSYGLPDRSVLEGGPPEKTIEVFGRLFAEKIKKCNSLFTEKHSNWSPLFCKYTLTKTKNSIEIIGQLI